MDFRDWNPRDAFADGRLPSPATRAVSFDWATVFLMVVAIVFLKLPVMNPSLAAPRSAHDADVARQQLVERQIAEFEAALAAEQAHGAASR